MQFFCYSGIVFSFLQSPKYFFLFHLCALNTVFETKTRRKFKVCTCWGGNSTSVFFSFKYWQSINLFCCYIYQKDLVGTLTQIGVIFRWVNRCLSGKFTIKQTDIKRVSLSTKTGIYFNLNHPKIYLIKSCNSIDLLDYIKNLQNV